MNADTARLCMGCMQPKEEDVEVCPRCGYRVQQRPPAVLPYQAVLNNKFLIGRILGRPGAFGVTYLAWDLVLHTTVAIKEYFPRQWVNRAADHSTVLLHSDNDKNQFAYGLEQFLREARMLAQFSHPNIVRIREFFQQNNTAYLVMDYCEGVSLEEFVQRKGGTIPEYLACKIMLPILDGLHEVHQKNVLHRDIKPSNIYLTKGDVPILLDFGAARFALGQNTQTLSIILTAGYAPFEQYLSEPGDLLGAWTDIYACGATLYSITTGIVPQNSINRHQKDDLIAPIDLIPTLTPPFNRAVLAALALEPKQRPQTISAFQTLLLGDETVAPNPARLPPPASQTVPPPALKDTPSQTAGADTSKPAIVKPNVVFIRCPHCDNLNSVPRGENNIHLRCKHCGDYINQARPASVFDWKNVALLVLLLLGIGVAMKSRQPPPTPLADSVAPAAEAPAEPADGSAENDAPSVEAPIKIEPPPARPSVEQPSRFAHPAPAFESSASDGNPPAHDPQAAQPMGEPTGHPPPLPPGDNGSMPGEEPPAAPPFALLACQSKREGDACVAPMQHIRGICRLARRQLACIPADAPPPPR